MDTNCDPDEVDYKIPGNDDAIRSIALLTRVITDAAVAGLAARSANAAAASDQGIAKPAAAAEPLSDWEKELIAVPADAAPAEAAAVVEAPVVETPATEEVAPEKIGE